MVQLDHPTFLKVCGQFLLICILWQILNVDVWILLLIEPFFLLVFLVPLLFEPSQLLGFDLLLRQIFCLRILLL